MGRLEPPFEYSHTYIQVLAFLKIGFKIAYRTVQGIVRGLSDYIRIEEMHFTHLRRRILKIRPSVASVNIDDDKPVTLIVDASGLSYYNKERRLHRTEMDQKEKRFCQDAPYCSRC